MDNIEYDIVVSKNFAKDLKRIIRSGRPDLREKVKYIFNELKKDPRKDQGSISS